MTKEEGSGLWLQLTLSIVTEAVFLPGKVFKMPNLKSIGKHFTINQTYPSPIWENMFKGVDWLPYEERLSKMRIIQLGKRDD